MSQTACHELISSLGPRYSEARWDDKRRILDEFTAVTGYHRKYAIAVLNHPPEERSNPICRPRGQRYDAEVQAVLMHLWDAAGGICGKRLVPFLPPLIEALERHGRLQFAVIRGGTGTTVIDQCRDGGPPDTHSAAQPSRG
jgi:hypothetical protein